MDNLTKFKELMYSEFKEAGIKNNDVILNTVVLRLMKKVYHLGAVDKYNLKRNEKKN